MQFIKKTSFNGVEFDCYAEAEKQDVSGEFWATREQIGQLLEYEYPAEAIRKIHQRNEVRLNKFSTRVILTLVEGERTVEREVVVYNFKGLLEICRFSSQPKADAVMDFLWDIADEIRRTGSYTDKSRHNEDNSRLINLEAARILQNMLNNNASNLDKEQRNAIIHEMFRLTTGKELTSSEFTHGTKNFSHVPKNNHKNKRNFKSNIKRLRIACGLTQKALAEILGTKRSTVGRWEIGIYQPCEAAQILLAKLFDCSVDELLNYPED